MGFQTWDVFDEYLDNHYHMTCQNVPVENVIAMLNAINRVTGRN